MLIELISVNFDLKDSRYARIHSIELKEQEMRSLRMHYLRYSTLESINIHVYDPALGCTGCAAPLKTPIRATPL